MDTITRSTMIDELAEHWIKSMTLDEAREQVPEGGGILHIRSVIFNRRTIALQALNTDEITLMYNGVFL